MHAQQVSERVSKQEEQSEYGRKGLEKEGRGEEVAVFVDLNLRRIRAHALPTGAGRQVRGVSRGDGYNTCISRPSPRLKQVNNK